MVIANNIAAMTILNESNKNLNKVSKILKQITTGEFVNSAADDASEYSIAARMKVRLRVLNQDDQNVQNGEAMLKVAEGAIQSQIDLTDAATLIGAQVNHLRSANNNIITSKENTAAAKSVLIDTDMAKAMLEYTKGKILSEAATSMMSNADRDVQDVVKLLQ